MLYTSPRADNTIIIKNNKFNIFIRSPIKNSYLTW